MLLAATPVGARNQDEPVANRAPDAEDVAMTPITDLNLAKDEIPSVLLAAQADPYASTGVRTCKDIAAAIAPLDAALGPDMDVVAGENDRISPGSVAKSVVASFIPFRGILRELTGAAEHQRDFQAAIYAGAVRRGYLKGLGQQKGCAYPARPAFARVKVNGRKAEDAKPVEQPNGEPATFVSQPVVQDVPGRRRR
ncbi:hypothetical protein N0B51_04360 [Tsuneonella sp. YG55]|uniref:Uncharacterized protein n=1 Tax=Tsuneonella litorea TaxID=2976475 RepID=A0A9X2W1C9_9SPHN|nr:hypothetical protein [Tsuneonella litorea]MCT2558206.1 hypothetical protein [Tsuneonella litorea]